MLPEEVIRRLINTDDRAQFRALLNNFGLFAALFLLRMWADKQEDPRRASMEVLRQWQDEAVSKHQQNMAEILEALSTPTGRFMSSMVGDPAEIDRKFASDLDEAMKLLEKLLTEGR